MIWPLVVFTTDDKVLCYNHCNRTVFCVFAFFRSREYVWFENGLICLGHLVYRDDPKLIVLQHRVSSSKEDVIVGRKEYKLSLDSHLEGHHPYLSQKQLVSVRMSSYDSVL